MKIPIIDIFAGPGGLGEGFCAYTRSKNTACKYKIVLSIEKDRYAHQTLLLRSFFHKFSEGKVPQAYYDFLKGYLPLEALYEKYPVQAEKAQNEAWLAELGESSNAQPNYLVDRRIKDALGGSKNWLLIGGPPCQAYSVVGRSRRRESFLDEEKDERVGLYKQYLRILAVHSPTVFIMENVKGLLSAKTKDSLIFGKILKDLSNPTQASLSEFRNESNVLACPGYRIYSLVTEPYAFDSNGQPMLHERDYVINCEKYGIPQTRHRVIMLGIRNDIDCRPELLQKQNMVPISLILAGLPKVRSVLTKGDSEEKWVRHLKSIINDGIRESVDSEVKNELQNQIMKLCFQRNYLGAEYMRHKDVKIDYKSDWYLDNDLGGVCNHSPRSHMKSDLYRYFYASCFARIKKRSPRLSDFPSSLLPAHKNINISKGNNKFDDRFRVQLWDNPCKTITSHISKDGHYFIHPDPTQCRSFTVREAARIQTFPDNYYFCGPRTSQFVQVGNAVPPLLAYQIAELVSKIFG